VRFDTLTAIVLLALNGATFVLLAALNGAA
jgi:hypothetical protein